MVLTVEELERLKDKIEEVLSTIGKKEPRFPPDIPKDLSSMTFVFLFPLPFLGVL